ncbi:uncharacterized protein LOC112041928 [Lingula anatina]|uniref:Uncharacterized protein LOC112041928 n=1 Tax=Lingula anatina TaxID=7574 RepID=A0A2R2MMN1_LINAN|nr:uncharacterized protein LOC112041928 [Lingula anatina]|eukprot:XP_023931471.1 uncharacterized protein LOC112041928 [Lingula anatina]
MPVSSTTRRKAIRKRNTNVNNEPLTSPAMATMMADLKRQAFNLKDSVAARKCAAGKLAEDTSYGELQDHIYELEADFRYTGYWLVSLLGQVCQTLDRIIERGFKKKPSECISFSSYVNIITEDEGDQFNAQSLVTKLLSDVTCLQTRQEQLKKIVDITAENIGDAVMDFVLVKHVSLAVLHATRLKRDLQVMTSAVDQILGPIREAAVKQPEIPSRDETAKEGAGNGMGPRRDDFKRKLEKSMEENILRNELIRLLRLNEN